MGRYIAFLSRRLAFSSIRQYLNAVRLLHLDAGFPNPLEGNWYVSSVLKGVRRVKGDTCNAKLPISIDILRGIFLRLNILSSFDRTFWAACVVGFFSFFRKSNLLIQSVNKFDPSRHLCASDVQFTPEGAVLIVRWSKVIQFRERVLRIPLPRISDSPLCPSMALLRMMLDLPHGSNSVPLFRFWENTHSPLTQAQFTVKLHSCLKAMGVDPRKYSGHSFRRGGATFALQCGLPVDLIKIQGDWNSNAYERYLQPSLDMRKRVASTMGAAAQPAFLKFGSHMCG